MSESNLPLESRSRQWVLAISSAVMAVLADLETRFDVNVEDLEVERIQRLIHVRSRVADDPSLVLTIEEAQAFLSIGRVKGFSVLYEFDGAPGTLLDRVKIRRLQSIARQGGALSLSEVDLVFHVAGFAIGGYSFLRVPFYERLIIPGFESVPELNWGNIDFGWPPFVLSRWSPSSS